MSRNDWKALVIAIVLIGIVFGGMVKFANFETMKQCNRQATIYQTEWRRNSGFFENQMCQYRIDGVWLTYQQAQDYLFIEGLKMQAQDGDA